LVYVSYKATTKGVSGWINSDPTSPTNIEDPDFVPPPKKEKKPNPVDSRFDIMDL